MDVYNLNLRSQATGQLCPALFFMPVPEMHLELWRQEWLPFLLESEEQDRHWDWDNFIESTRENPNYLSCSILCQNSLQALALFQLNVPSRLANGPCVYIERVATAPWNRSDIHFDLKLNRAGSYLLRAAVQISLSQGWEGRIGLHSLPNSEIFYRAKLGMYELGRDPDHESLSYFEFTSEMASAFYNLEPE